MAQDLARLNSLTKYPSVPTYHALGERGALLDRRVEFTGDVIVTEKVNGGNGRIALLPGNDWLIGSREEWLTAKDDRVPDRTQGIVEVLAPIAERLCSAGACDDDTEWTVTTIYLEVYGSRDFDAWKAYGKGTPAVRLFDVSICSLHLLIDNDREHLARWRDAGGQSFMHERGLIEFADQFKLPLVPRITTIDAGSLPATLEETRAWLKSVLPTTLVAVSDGGTGRPEGVVLRDYHRSKTAKVRFEDYERAIARRAAQAS
jgi:hypothetical protein